MLLTIDIGNTNITLGVFDGERLVRHWRIGTKKARTADEYGLMLMSLLSHSSIAPSELDAAVMSSVVPPVQETALAALRDYLGIRPLVVEPGVKTGMPIMTDNPREVGADRIVNAVAAYDRFKGPVIVVDFGTAVTLDYITARGEYAGGAIAPGVSVSAEALFHRTSKLPRIELKRPRSVIGKNTLESLRSGLFYGFLSLVDGMVERMRSEAAAETGTGRMNVIATGGFAALFAGGSRTIDETDEFLTLKGLRIIHDTNRPERKRAGAGL
ncbi:MAG TPA: type III pantothenate kinase [Deltaproteobacteria bacterium]|nr:type III pantothenate kinase [Deltaproteobacteria bacterium]